MKKRLTTFACAVATLLLAQGVAAQSDPSLQQQNPSGTTESEPGNTIEPPTRGSTRAPSRARPSGRNAADSGTAAGEAADTESWRATVEVVDGITGDPIPKTGVELKATRPVGPFESRDPEPKKSWTAQTDASGQADFEELSGRVLQQGLEVYATTRHNGIQFESARQTPGDSLNLTIEVYPQGTNADAIKIKRLRTVVEPWEDFLVLTQFWTLTVEGNTVLDTTMLPEGHLPLELPTDAKGIHAFGPGENKVVDSTVQWKGVLRPGETVALRTRFSMSTGKPSFVFRQSIDYPVDDVQVVVPLQTEHEKVGRLDDASLIAENFESVSATRDVPGFRRDKGYLFARGRSLEPGESFAVKMTGLPFDRPIGPWVAFGLGVLGIFFIVTFAGREKDRLDNPETRQTALEKLREEREELLDELADLEEAWEDDDVSEVTYETESLRLRERLSLVMRKIDELSDETADGADD